MKAEKTNKTKKVKGNKLSTADAIAFTLKTHKKKKAKLSKSLKKLPITIDKSDSINDFNSLPDNWSFKQILTVKAKKFLSLYISGNYTILSAMRTAGYEGNSESALYDMARRIRCKVEVQADDHKKLFRELGAGEVLVVKTLLSLIEDPSAKIRLGAVTQLAKILDLTKEQLEGAGGVTLVFEGPGTTANLPGGPGAPPLLPSQGEIKVVPTSRKPMMITK